MLNKIVKALIESRDFISVATADLNNRPNAAPKFLLKIQGDFIYLVDYIIGRTYENLKINPQISLSFFDSSTLIGYQVNGRVEIIKSGAEYATVLKELQAKEIDLSTKRVIEGVTRGKAHQTYEVAIPEKFVIFKVKVDEIVEMSPRGTLKREKIS